MLVGILTALTLVAFALNSLLCRLALGGELIDPVSFSTLRLVSGAIILTPMSRLTAESRPAPERKGSWGSGVALFVYAIAFSLAYVSLDTGMGALILFGTVQVTMISAGLRSGDWPHPVEWLGLAAALGGLVYLVLPGISTPNPLGAVLMVLSGIAWGVYSLRGKGTATPILATADNFIRTVPMATIASILALSCVRVETIGLILARIIHQRRKKRLTEPGFTTKDAVTGCWEVCSAEIGRWEVKNGVFGTQHSRRQLRNRVFGPSWAAKWGEVCPRRARRSLAQGMRS